MVGEASPAAQPTSEAAPASAAAAKSAPPEPTPAASEAPPAPVAASEAPPAPNAAASSAPPDPTLAVGEAPPAAASEASPAPAREVAPARPLSWHSAQASKVFIQTYGARNTPDQRGPGICSIDLLECPRFFSDWDKHIGTHGEGLRAMLQDPSSRQHVAAAPDAVWLWLACGPVQRNN